MMDWSCEQHNQQLAALMTTPLDDDAIDLGALFAPLQRDEIEMLLVKLLAKYPAEADWIVPVNDKIETTQQQWNKLFHT